MRKFIAECILGVMLAGLMANAWAVWNDVQELKIKEPITKEQFKEDINELKTSIKELQTESREIKTLLLNMEK